mgnify:CR=1 FL=1
MRSTSRAGRSRVRRSTGDVIWFDFAAICAGPRSQSDYVEIARDFHAVAGVGRAAVRRRAQDNEARRFVALVDEFYDRNVKLVLSAHAPVARALSRRAAALRVRAHDAAGSSEMQSHDYLSRAHRP